MNVNRYLLQNHSICLEALCVCVCVRRFWCMSAESSVRGRCERRLLSFNLLCPWACQLSLYACFCVFMRVHDGFSYQFMGDYVDSFHSYFSPWIFYHRINKRQFQGCYAYVGTERGQRGAVAVIHGCFLSRQWKTYTGWIGLKGDSCVWSGPTLTLDCGPIKL